jgi:hypothetical protein
MQVLSLCPPRTRMMTNIQNREPLSRQTTGNESLASRSVEASEPLPVKRLDEEVTISGEYAFAEGSHCQVWLGQWEKVGDKGVVSEKVDAEETNLGLPLTSLFAGGVENASNTQVARGSASGLIFAVSLYAPRSRLLPRSSETRTRTSEVGRTTSSKSLALLWCVSPRPSSRKVPTVVQGLRISRRAFTW